MHSIGNPGNVYFYSGEESGSCCGYKARGFVDCMGTIFALGMFLKKLVFQNAGYVKVNN